MSEQRNISQDVFVALREAIADYFSTQNVGELVFALERENEVARGEIGRASCRERVYSSV